MFEPGGTGERRAAPRLAQEEGWRTRRGGGGADASGSEGAEKVPDGWR